MGYIDRIKNTGSDGQMMVRDGDHNGYAGVIGANEVQFFVRSKLAQTSVGSPGFRTSVYYNGAWVGLDNVANYSNSKDWRKVGTIRVDYAQTITFHINSSGTQGFGGPTDFQVQIDRKATSSTSPSPPGTPTFSNKTPTSVKVSWSASTNDGGSPIDAYLLRIAEGNGVFTNHSSSNDLSRTVTGLISGRSYVFRVQAHNGSADNNGYSNPSGDSTLTMYGAVRVRSSGVWVDAIPYVRESGVWKMASPYIRDAGIWKQTS